jgi:serine/threonine protein kinase HipA of HipAB toxin-antitoxin module
MPISVICVAAHGGTDESSSDDLRMGWQALQSQTADRWGEARDWMNGVTSGTITACFGANNSAGNNEKMTFSITNQPFQIWCTDNFLGGWTMDVYFTYTMVDA